MRIARLSIAAASLLVPSHALMATGDSLQSDIELWSDFQTEMSAEEQADSDDAAIYDSSELFPGGGSSSSTGVIDGTRDERTGDLLTVTSGGETVTFKDIRLDQWFAPYVREIAKQGIVSGYRDAQGNALGLFGPADSVTVEQMAKVLMGASSTFSSCGGTGALLNTTAAGTWSEPYILCGEERGWTVYADGTVDIARPATRSEVVVTVLQSFGIEAGEVTAAPFTDVALTAQFTQSIAKAKEDGIIAGYSDASGNPTGQFGPDDPVNRAEFAKIVTLALQIYGQR